MTHVPSSPRLDINDGERERVIRLTAFVEVVAKFLKPRKRPFRHIEPEVVLAGTMRPLIETQCVFRRLKWSDDDVVSA